jgi:hypothetical protein
MGSLMPPVVVYYPVLFRSYLLKAFPFSLLLKPLTRACPTLACCYGAVVAPAGRGFS